MDSEEERSQESETETVIDLSLGSTHEDFKAHNSSLPSRWSMWRLKYRDLLAEYFGTLLMILLGNAAIAADVLTGNKLAMFPSIGYGLAVSLAIYITGDISGAHLNPVITVVLALFRKFPPKKIIPYAVAQFFGAFSAAAILYINVAGDLDLIDGGHRQIVGKNATLQIFTTTPRTSVDNLSAITSEILCTAVLLFIIFALMNRCDPSHRTAQPVFIGMLVTLVSVGMGVNTGPSMNPVRDLGPRTFTALAGWGMDVFTANNYYFWIPSLIPFLGGALGAFLYDSFLSI